ncbi:MAG: hypothetical protein HY290_03860 [Planctomycetia bacterium]|nr:hypothetical protein [Planctomycetia bacterium]
MTIFNRALLKAYERRSDSVAATELEQHPSAVVRGWAKKLREPIRPVPQDKLPAEMPATESAPTTTTAALPSPVEQEPHADKPVATLHRAEGKTLRFDEAHEHPAGTAQNAALAPSKIAAEFHDGPVPAPPHFSWPTIVGRLLASPAADELRELADRLLELATHCDLRCVAFGGPGRRAGRTSLLVTLAWVLAEEKASRVAIVDAQFNHPGLAAMLAYQSGPQAKAPRRDGGSDPVESLADLSENLVLAPLIERVPAETIDREGIGAWQALLRSLRGDHDIVLVDAGSWEQDAPPPILECRAIDAFVCVARTGESSTSPIIGEHDLEQLGIDWLGEVETFVPAAVSNTTS